MEVKSKTSKTSYFRRRQTPIREKPLKTLTKFEWLGKSTVRANLNPSLWRGKKWPDYTANTSHGFLKHQDVFRMIVELFDIGTIEGFLDLIQLSRTCKTAYNMVWYDLDLWKSLLRKYIITAQPYRNIESLENRDQYIRHFITYQKKNLVGYHTLTAAANNAKIHAIFRNGWDKLVERINPNSMETIDTNDIFKNFRCLTLSSIEVKSLESIGFRSETGSEEFTYKVKYTPHKLRMYLISRRAVLQFHVGEENILGYNFDYYIKCYEKSTNCFTSPNGKWINNLQLHMALDSSVLKLFLHKVPEAIFKPYMNEILEMYNMEFTEEEKKLYGRPQFEKNAYF